MPLNLTKSEFLAHAAKLYDTLDADLDSHNQNFYDYEEKFVAHLQRFSKETLAQSISSISENTRKKKRYRVV